MADTTTKPWYKSKIVLLGITAVLIFGGSLLYRFLLGSGVTPEQLAAIEQQNPQITAAIQQIQTGENVWQALGVLFGSLVVIVRVWFTNKLIPQSSN